jgi:ABC-type transporter Mla maintaining outer membrane lipid asymmetry ATPase subunit MlaF
MVALMSDGKIAFYGTTDELTTTDNRAVRNFIARGRPGRRVGSGDDMSCESNPFA